MKTDIVGSTPAFRALLTTDRLALLHSHSAFVAHHAAEQGGHILESAGDGYWLRFSSVTGAAKSAISMQEALRLAQPNKGDDRLSIRIVIGLGDIAILDGAMIGDTVPLVIRVETITPADEIYLTSAANQALSPSEVQTAFVDSFLLKGFAQPVSFYRVEQRHRTHIIINPYILFSDLRGFTRLTEAEPVSDIESLLDAIDTLISSVSREYGGTIRSSIGDSHWVTFSEAVHVAAAADRLSRDWAVLAHENGFGCPINISVHRGRICMFRSFIYGDGILISARVQEASRDVLAGGEGGIFVTSAVREDLSGSWWYGRLQPVELTRRVTHFPGLSVYRLVNA